MLRIHASNIIIIAEETDKFHVIYLPLAIWPTKIIIYKQFKVISYYARVLLNVCFSGLSATYRYYIMMYDGLHTWERMSNSPKCASLRLIISPMHHYHTLFWCANKYIGLSCICYRPPTKRIYLINYILRS